MTSQAKVKEQMCGCIAYLKQEVEDLGFVLIGINTTDTAERGAIDMTTLLCNEHLVDLLKEALAIVEGKRADRTEGGRLSRSQLG